MSREVKIDPKQELHETIEDQIVVQPMGKTIEENMMLYSDLVISNRAVPSVLDGLKPVNRRSFYAFKEGGHVAKNIKSARITGDIIGKFHPHGDMAVYGALVEMTQVFKNKTPLTEGQGNWGSIEGDSPAAQRYTEVKLPQDSSNILFENIEKEGVVTWKPNFDDTEVEPEFLPTKYPISILNGTTGIAYAGVTAKIPSYNIKELTNLYIYLIENKFYDKSKFNILDHKENIMGIVKTVDLPTGSNIYFEEGSSALDTVFESSFKFRMRASYELDEKNKRIIFWNIPIDTNADRIKEEIIKIGLSYKEVNGKKIPKTDEKEILNIDAVEGVDVKAVSSFKDNNYKNDAKITVHLKKSANLNLELIKLFKYTSLDHNYSAKMTMIDDEARPRNYSLYEQTRIFLQFRLHVMYQAFLHDIKKLDSQLHNLYGLRIVLEDLKNFINLIQETEDEVLNQTIMDKYKLSEIQSDYVLSIPVRKLSNTSITKLHNEIEEKESNVNILKEKISTDENLYEEVKKDYQELLTKNIVSGKKSQRLSKIIQAKKSVDKSDLIENKEVILMYMEDNTIGYVEKDQFRIKNRGTKTSNNKSNKDFNLNIKVTENCELKDEVYIMTNLGKVFKIFVYDFTKEFKLINNTLNLDLNENIISIKKVDEDNKYYSILTANGKIKGLNKSLLKNVTGNRGKTAINLEEKDTVISFEPFNLLENEKTILITSEGRVLKYSTEYIKILNAGNTKGVKSAKLNDNEVVISNSIFIETEDSVVIGVSDIGKAKKTNTINIADKKRAQSPNIFFNNSKENGNIIGGDVFVDVENEYLMLLTKKANVSLVKIKDFNAVSKNAKGAINLINLEAKEKLKICKKITNISEDAEDN